MKTKTRPARMTVVPAPPRLVEAQEILYRMPDVRVITGQGRATIYRAVAEGTFPAPVRLGAMSVAWRKSDLDRWIAERQPARARNRKTRQRA